MHAIASVHTLCIRFIPCLMSMRSNSFDAFLAIFSQSVSIKYDVCFIRSLHCSTTHRYRQWRRHFSSSLSFSFDLFSEGHTNHQPSILLFSTHTHTWVSYGRHSKSRKGEHARPCERVQERRMWKKIAG